MWGGEAPHIFGWFQSPQGPPRPQKPTHKIPARLPSGTQAGPPPGVSKTTIYQERGAILGGPGPAFPTPSRRIGGSRGSRTGIKNIYFELLPEGSHALRAAEGPPSGPPPFLVKNKVEGRPRGARGRPREAPRTPQDPQKPSKNHQKTTC